jgi:subtilisin family serine protease
MGGTSFSTPIVSGVCALLKSLNKCLTPADIQDIIKATADPIADAHLYPNGLGAGRINAYKAVQMAQNYLSPTVISSSQTWNTPQTLCGDLIIENGATLTLSATSVTTIQPGNKVVIKNGGKLVVNGGSIKNGKLIAQNGSRLEMKNNGQIYLRANDDLDIQLGAIFDCPYGKINVE